MEQSIDAALTAQERDQFRLALTTCVSDLHTKIAHPDRYEFRQEIKAKRALLLRVLHRMGGAPQPAAGRGEADGAKRS